MILPTLRQLQYLVAVMELRHFGRAAERCFVSQSTLSAGIRELETLLSIQLLERTKRKVIPTPAGMEIARLATEILSRTGELVERAQQHDRPLSGTLRVGVIPTIGPFMLPKVLAGIRERYPELKVYLIEDQSARLLDRLARGEIDTAVLALPYDIGALESKVFWRENFMVAVPRGHHLSRAKALTSGELPADELLLLEEGHCMRDHALAACRLKDFPRTTAFQGTSLYTLIQMVNGGQGITFLPEMAIESDLIRQADIRFLPLKEKGPHRELGLVWRPSYHKKRDLELLADNIQGLLSASMPDPSGP